MQVRHRRIVTPPRPCRQSEPRVRRRGQCVGRVPEPLAAADSSTKETTSCGTPVACQLAHDGCHRPRGPEWRYEYDLAGCLMSESDFDGRTVTYTYDAANRMTSRTNSLGQTFRFEHDSLGKVVVKDIDGEVTTPEYDIVGELAAATGTTAMRSRLPGRHGRLRSGTVNGRTAIHQYDRLGRRVGRTTAGGVVNEWTFDAV
ncbi:hypothetical protein ACFC5Z_26155 [Streptomyces sp. NPDC056004]|uniref:hypothetical protein n=1 Tax=unclassified Streptomyces TaxID=2593676 RepID=UPI0035E39CA1